MRSSYGSADQRDAGVEATAYLVGAVARALLEAAGRRARAAVRPTSPRTPNVSSRWAPSASAVSSTCTTVAPGGDQRAVAHRPHVEGAAPADDQVGVADQLGSARATRSRPRPRATTGGRANSPLATADSASSAPERRGRIGDARDPRRGRRARPRRPAARHAVRPRPADPTPARRSSAPRRSSLSRPRPEPRQARPTEPPARPRAGSAGRYDVRSPPVRTASPATAAAVAGSSTRIGTAPTARRQRLLVDVEVRPRLGRLGGDDHQRGPALGGLGDPGHRVGQPAALVHRDGGRRAPSYARRRRPSSPPRPRAARRRTGRPRRPWRW